MRGGRLQVTAAILAVLAGPASAQSDSRAVSLPWNTDAGYGPDGPWNYLKMNVGTSPVDFYPIFGIHDSIVVRSDASGYSSAIPRLSPMPRYYQSSSSSATYSDQDLNKDSTLLPPYFLSQSESGSGYFWTDTISGNNSTSSSTALFVSPNMTQSHGSKPWIPISLLSLEPNSASTPYDNMPLAPSGKSSKTILESYTDGGGSNSVALHVGAAMFNQSGSLVLGGFDQSRLINQPASMSEFGSMRLINLSIGTSSGTSPFGSRSASLPPNFLNSGTMNVLLSPHVATMQLPQAVCDMLGQYLPLESDRDTGLPLWDTSNPLYKDLISSPTYLSFTFLGDNNSNTTVRVPFAALNLYLTAPIKDSPTPYFPCEGRAAGDENINKEAKFNLGRAFLQSAFLLQSWANNNGGRDSVYIGQAPGPNFTASSDSLTTFSNNNLLVKPASDAPTWEETWGTVLKPLGAPAESGASTSSALSTGAVVGVVFGVMLGIAFFVALVLALVFLRRRKAKRQEQLRSVEQGGWNGSKYGRSPVGSINVKALEIDGTVRPLPPQEMDSAHWRYEVHSAGSGSTHEMSGMSRPAEMPAEYARW